MRRLCKRPRKLGGGALKSSGEANRREKAAGGEILGQAAANAQEYSRMGLATGIGIESGIPSSRRDLNKLDWKST